MTHFLLCLFASYPLEVLEPPILANASLLIWPKHCKTSHNAKERPKHLWQKPREPHLGWA
jgi:hypothetical protein